MQEVSNKRKLPLDFKIIFKINCILYFKEKGIIFPFPYFCLFLVQRIMFVILTGEDVGFCQAVEPLVLTCTPCTLPIQEDESWNRDENNLIG